MIMKNLKIIVKENSKRMNSEVYNSLFDHSYNGIMISPKDAGSAPVAWDCGFEIEGNNVIISGGVGSSGYGSVTIKFPKKDFNDLYDVIIEPRNVDDVVYIKNMLSDCNMDVEFTE